jgi:secreted trypsin-like serine protease
MKIKLAIVATGFFASTTACVANETFLKFDKSSGVSDFQFSAMESQRPAILQGAPPSEAAERAIADWEGRGDPRIVGGMPLRIEDAPWQVGLIFASGPEPVRVQFCGGSLILPNWVMTAAHCVDRGTKPDDVDIIVGTAFYKNFGERLNVKAIIPHEKWDPGTMENDIALLELKTPATQGKVVELIGASGSIDPGTKLRVTGWGALSEGGRGSEILMGADIPTVTNEICNAEGSYNGRIKPSMICAGLRGGGLDSCQGDSGGPAVATTSEGKKVLAGVVSWGSGCARRLKYGVYTNVASFRTWVDGKLKAPQAAAPQP